MEKNPTAIEVPVLIVGGSLVGLSAALFLNWHGVSTLNVERHGSTAIHPRAGHFHLRTLELFRQVGLEQAIVQASHEQFGRGGGINSVESLAGKEIAQYITDLNAGVEAFSPSKRLFLSQQRLEPLIRSRAEELGAALRYATELVSFDQNDTGVTAVIKDLATGEQSIVRAPYMIAADGNRSPIRERLGIDTSGPGHLSDSITIYFKADLEPYVRDREHGVIYVFNEQLRGFFRLEKAAQSGFLVVSTLGDTTKSGSREVGRDITKDKCIALLRSAIGVADLEVDILDVAIWKAHAATATHFRSGRVFLAGDAAHVMPPSGGFGGNTGIHDAHNIAWKLSLVHRGIANEGLLDTYEAERRPICVTTMNQAYSRWVRRIDPELGLAKAPALVDDLTLEIGYRCPPQIANAHGGDYYSDPHTRPSRSGDRAPHLALKQGGAMISVLDLFGQKFVLLAGDEGDTWLKVGVAAAANLRLPLNAYRIGKDSDLIDVDGSFQEKYGLEAAGAALVRPDGFIAWQSQATDTPSLDSMSNVLRRFVGFHESKVDA
jgi:2-polyprenyl-6-methoxyphenol hydroxylase-like FAD-dependent oxidoreductase